MTTLSQQIVQLQEQLKLNQQAYNARHILGEYEAIRSPLSKVGNSLRTMFDHYKILQNLPEDTPEKMVFSAEIKESAKNTLFVLRAFAELWQQNEHEARQGNDLANATQSLESLTAACLGEVGHCWHNWVSYLESYVALEDILLQSQKNIPGLEVTYTNFVKSRNRFRELINQLPQSSGVINELQQLTTTMQDLKGEMQFDLPEEVSAFFKELDAPNRNVSVSALTPEVFEWLHSHNLLGEYVVSRRRRY